MNSSASLRHDAARRRIVVAACAAIVAAGCGGFDVLQAAAADDAPGQDAPAIRFADASIMSVDATSLSLVVENRPPAEYPHIVYRAPFSFEQAAHAWADSHFRLTGNSVNTLRITLHAGDIVEKLLPRTHGLKGLFTKDQGAQYDASLSLEVALVDPSGKVLASANGKAFDTQTIVEGATETDKRTLWSGMITTTFDHLDAELQPQIRAAMAQYVH